MKFDENLAAIHAYLCSDGYVIKNPQQSKNKYYYIGFRNTNLILLEDFQRVFFNYFKIKPRLNIGQRCVIQNKELYRRLVKEFSSFYSWEWRMPKLSHKLLRIWLRAYFDCDGWVTVQSHQNRMIGLDCVNIDGLLQIKTALNSLGIKSTIKKRNTRNIFSLAIYDKYNLIKFKDKIGFFHPDKKIKLEKAIADYVNYNWVFPKEKDKLSSFIQQLMRHKAKIKRDNKIFFIISNKKNNLVNLQNNLKSLYNIESKLNKNKNGIGTTYFQLNINKKSEINKLIEHELINEEFKEEWIKLKK